MADRGQFDEDDVFAPNPWNDSVADDPDLWEETPPIIEGAGVQHETTPGWEASAADGVGREPLRTPPPRVLKRRIVGGVLFLVLGLIGVLADGFDIDVEIAATVASVIGAVVLLGGLIASERRRRQIIQLS